MKDHFQAPQSKTYTSKNSTSSHEESNGAKQGCFHVISVMDRGALFQGIHVGQALRVRHFRRFSGETFDLPNVSRLRDFKSLQADKSCLVLPWADIRR
jgi:hypothetical protein